MRAFPVAQAREWFGDLCPRLRGGPYGGRRARTSVPAPTFRRAVARFSRAFPSFRDLPGFAAVRRIEGRQ